MISQDDAHEGLDRRQALTKIGFGGAVGAAVWAAPAILTIGDSASAQTSSACGPVDVPEFSTWTAFNNGEFGASGDLGYLLDKPDFAGFGEGHFVESDPTAPTAVATYTTSIVLEAGRTYSFIAEAAERRGEDHQVLQTVTLEISQDGSSWTPLSSLTTTGSAPSGWPPPIPLGTLANNYEAPESGTYQIRFRHTFGAAGVANDIGVAPPAITCIS